MDTPCHTPLVTFDMHGALMDFNNCRLEEARKEKLTRLARLEVGQVMQHFLCFPCVVEESPLPFRWSGACLRPRLHPDIAFNQHSSRQTTMPGRWCHCIYCRCCCIRCRCCCIYCRSCCIYYRGIFGRSVDEVPGRVPPDKVFQDGTRIGRLEGLHVR
jgi:hypothetical protein